MWSRAQSIEILNNVDYEVKEHHFINKIEEKEEKVQQSL